MFDFFTQIIQVRCYISVNMIIDQKLKKDQKKICLCTKYLCVESIPLI